MDKSTIAYGTSIHSAHRSLYYHSDGMRTVFGPACDIAAALSKIRRYLRQP